MPVRGKPPPPRPSNENQHNAACEQRKEHGDKIDDANAEKDQDNGAANHKSKDSEAEMSIIMRAEMAKVMTTQKQRWHKQ